MLGFYSQKAFLSWHPSKAVAVAAVAAAEPQIREQMSGPDPHVFTLKFLALKKTGFSPIKNTFQIFFDFCLLLFYATFQCGP